MIMDESIYVAEVIHISKSCSAGHKVGDRFKVNIHKTSGIYGYSYHDLFPTLVNCCYGGRMPWVDSQDL